MERMLTIICSVTSTMLVASLGALWKMWKSKEAKDKADNDLLLCLARTTLLTMISNAKKVGYTTIQEHDVIVQLYNAYRIKGGNGTIRHMFEEEYDKLEIREES